jgi:hypothetical protein
LSHEAPRKFHRWGTAKINTLIADNYTSRRRITPGPKSVAIAGTSHLGRLAAHAHILDAARKICTGVEIVCLSLAALFSFERLIRRIGMRFASQGLLSCHQG